MLKNVAVLVTGAAGTLGSATAKKLISEGCKVTLLDLPDSKGQEIADKLGENAFFTPGDVTSEEDVLKALDFTTKEFGWLRTVINCAGVHRANEIFNFNKKRPINMDTFKEVLNVNVCGTVNVIRLALQYMSENPVDRNDMRGVIINTSGYGAHDGQRGQSALAASWGAISSLTLPLCRECGIQGIRVMTISPGLMDSNLTNFWPSNVMRGITALTPHPKRLGYKEEFADLVLCIMQNNFLNGEVIRLDGGLSLSNPVGYEVSWRNSCSTPLHCFEFSGGGGKEIYLEMFNQGGLGGTTFGLPGAKVGQTTHNPVQDFEVTSPPDDSVSSLRFSPASLPQNFLIAGSWDNNVRCWEVEQSGKTIPKSIQSMDGPILDVCWHDDGTKVFMASCDKQVKAWDLASNQTMQVAAHDAPVKTCHWIQSGAYSCLMTGSWDKTLKFWDTRTPNPMLTINLPERVYCADVDFPMAVVGTAGRTIIVYQLEGKPQEFKRIDSPLKYQHRCIAIFRDKKKQPAGFALGSVEGRVSIQYVNQAKDSFSFKCHRVSNSQTKGFHDIYAVNDLKFHPVHGTLATVGSDGSMSFWDKDARTKLKPFDPLDQPIVACAFNHSGHIFAYAASYDWSKGHEYYNPAKKSAIYLRSVFDEMKARASS